ncbi:hypothetical protein JXI42_05215 [bacterium]|nr:hypothetical protein [bacterium]
MKIPTLYVILILILLTNIVIADTTFVSGTVYGTWNSDHSPFMVEAEIKVPTDSCLRIMPGCNIIFLGHYKLNLDSSATIKAIGTYEDSIFFSATDTNLTDSSGGFYGIRLNHSAPGCSLVYCKIEFGNS